MQGHFLLDVKNSIPVLFIDFLNNILMPVILEALISYYVIYVFINNINNINLICIYTQGTLFSLEIMEF